MASALLTSFYSNVVCTRASLQTKVGEDLSITGPLLNVKSSRTLVWSSSLYPTHSWTQVVLISRWRNQKINSPNFRNKIWILFPEFYQHTEHNVSCFLVLLKVNTALYSCSKSVKFQLGMGLIQIKSIVSDLFNFNSYKYMHAAASALQFHRHL